MNDALHVHLEEIYTKCLHCGLCLPVCPTYNLTFKEESSPRGRIRLMRSVYNGELDITDAFVDEMYFCLDCQACQTACPAGVRYGELVEETRNVIAEKRREPSSLRFLKKTFLRGVLSSNRATKLVGRLLQFYQRSGLRDAIEQSGILQVFSEQLDSRHRLLPTASSEFFDEVVPEILPAIGMKGGRVAFLSGCIMNVSFADVHRDAVEVLQFNGFEVVVPKEQVCCGSLHAHNGDIEKAKELAKTNIDVFNRYDVDAIVIDSAGCGAFMKEYGQVLADDATYAERAALLSKKVKDVSEFLAEIELIPPTKSINKRITYHDACHLVHTQKISEQPRKLLKMIPGIEFVELPESTWCCGSAGIYTIVRYDDSMKMLERKMQNIASTNADIVVTANPGCHIQLQHGIKQFSLKMEVMHPMSLLRRAYGKAGSLE